MHACGVDIVKVGVFDRNISPFMLSVLNRLTGRGISIVLVLFAELYPPDIDFQRLRRGGITGVMLDTCEKANGNLRDKLDDATLAEFVRKAGRAGLVTGLAGSLTKEDIPPLLEINPDYLGVPRCLVQTTPAHFRDGRRESCQNQEADSEKFSFHNLGGSLGWSVQEYHPQG